MNKMIKRTSLVISENLFFFCRKLRPTFKKLKIHTAQVLKNRCREFAHCMNNSYMYIRKDDGDFEPTTCTQGFKTWTNSIVQFLNS